MSSRTEFTYLSSIEAYRSGNSIVVQLRTRAVDVGFTVDGDTIAINESDFRSLVESDDVSLSNTERVELLAYLETLATE